MSDDTESIGEGVSRPLPRAGPSTPGILLLYSEAEPWRGRVWGGARERVVGRQPDQPIFVDDTALSRQHAKIRVQPDVSATVEDLGSHNGTFVNGRRLSGPHLVRPGDVIRCGRTLLTLVESTQAYEGWPAAAMQEPLVGGPALLGLRRKLPVVAQEGSAVLVSGESGTGKEVVAGLVHQLSQRPGRLVAVNCTAVPESLFEAELFGVCKGAFTGAVSDRPGLIRQADRGTLFLDEIGDLPLALQPKLLRALEQRSVTSVGGQSEEKVDLRLVSATHQDLAEQVAAGRFREDLYYRIRRAVLPIPALRARRDDVVPLLWRALKARRAPQRSELVPSALFVERLLTYPWPGNVRQLLNVVLEALIEAQIDGSDTLLPAHLNLGPAEREEDRGELEKVRSALSRNKGHVVRTAEELGVSRRVIYEILRKHGLKPGAFR